jgi:hypothetical protein
METRIARSPVPAARITERMPAFPAAPRTCELDLESRFQLISILTRTIDTATAQPEQKSPRGVKKGNCRHAASKIGNSDFVICTHVVALSKVPESIVRYTFRPSPDRIWGKTDPAMQ